MLLDSVEPRRHPTDVDDAAARQPHTPAAGELLRWLGRVRDQLKQDRQGGNHALYSSIGGAVVLGPLRAAEAALRVGVTMARPVSLGEVLGWSPAQKMGITLPCAAPCAHLRSPACASHDHTVLSASQGERFVLRHGDNYGHVEVRQGDGKWEPVAAVADYMPAGIGRRYLREVGKVYGEFQRRRSGSWVTEPAPHGRRVRLYLIDGRFEMLTDEQHALRSGGRANASAGRSTMSRRS